MGAKERADALVDAWVGAGFVGGSHIKLGAMKDDLRRHIEAEIARLTREREEAKREIDYLNRELEQAKGALERERGACTGCGESGPKTCCACYQAEVAGWTAQFRAQQDENNRLRARAEQAEAERDRLRVYQTACLNLCTCHTSAIADSCRVCETVIKVRESRAALRGEEGSP